MLLMRVVQLHEREERCQDTLAANTSTTTQSVHLQLRFTLEDSVEKEIDATVASRTALRGPFRTIDALPPPSQGAASYVIHRNPEEGKKWSTLPKG
jgi:hypothetical protein